ncbi:tetratricopeptide repeat protein [Litorilinea aerophila]|nr:tetratricopeptide repeat protein [Litorilinea aerophila]MCC9078808.1 tetratricopeptide repeat protein [Litorilinea aerophila]
MLDTLQVPILFKHARWILVIVAFFSILVFESSSWLIACAWTNVTNIFLNHTVFASPEVSEQQQWRRIESLFQQALFFHPTNQSAKRGMVIVLALQGNVESAAEIWREFGNTDLPIIASVSSIMETADPKATIDFWRTVGTTGQRFVDVGNKALENGPFEVAEKWYLQATTVEPDLADAWFSLGILYERHNMAKKADLAYRRASRSSKFITIGKSSPFCRRGWVNLELYSPPDLKTALAVYDRATTLNDFATDKEAADCYFYKAETLSRIDMAANLDTIVLLSQRAIRINPQHILSRVLLGVAYMKQGRFVEAESEFVQAIEISPKYSWAYYYLGQVYEQRGEINQAFELYKQALAINPQLTSARDRLAVLQEIINSR